MHTNWKNCTINAITDGMIRWCITVLYIGEQQIDTLTINTMIPEQTFIFNFPKLSKYECTKMAEDYLKLSKLL